MKTGAKIIADSLIESGIDHVFCIPVFATGPIYDSLYVKNDKINVILTRHEQSASIMTDVYGRVNRRPALLMGQGPFIATSGGFGISEAYLSYSPMIIITDTCDIGLSQLGSYQNVTGEYGTIDVPGILRAMTKYTTFVSTPNEAILGLNLAIKHSLSGANGPAAVLMKSDVPISRYRPDPKIPNYPIQGYINNETPIAPYDVIKKVCESLISAKFPVVIAGNGIHNSRAYEELRELAEILECPVTTTYKGRSSIEETHRLAVGPMGAFGINSANTAISRADVILVIGARMRAHDTSFYNLDLINPTEQTIFQIDIEPLNAGWTIPVEAGLIGDAKQILKKMNEYLTNKISGINQFNKRALSISKLKKEEKYFDDSEKLLKDSSPVLPQRLVRLIQETIDPSTIITLDAGNNRLWMHHFFQTQNTGTILGPGGHGGMGWAVPAAVGAKIVRPKRPVMAVTGDGGFMMTSNAISTAIQNDSPVVIVVFNDGALGMVREHQRRDKTIIASEFVNTNYAQLCRAYGGWGVQINDSKDIPTAIHDAFSSGVASVIDVTIDDQEIFNQFQPKIKKTKPHRLTSMH